MSLVITQGYGASGGGGFTGTLTGTIPQYSSTEDTYLITVDSGVNPPIRIIFDEEVTGLLKRVPEQ